jgi:hypothetical protein
MDNRFHPPWGKFPGGSDDNNDTEMMMTPTMTMVVASIRSNVGMDATAPLCQGPTMHGKCSERKCQRDISVSQ